LKLAGALLIIFASTAAGWLCGLMLRKRRKNLADLRRLLQWLETEIGYNLLPLREAFFRISQRLEGEVALFATAFVRFLDAPEGLTAGEAWQRAIQNCREQLVLAGPDWMILEDLGCNLGTTDREHQLKAVREGIERVKIQETAVEEQAAKNEKLYRYLGMAAGTLAVLLFY
jgi:stage III sporulation protein AB